MLDTIERQYKKQVWKSFGLRDRISEYKSELKEAWLEGVPFRPLWIRINTRYFRMISPLVRAPVWPGFAASWNAK